MLPVSSSGHLVLVPALLRWPYTELDGELRKSFEVALHAGTAIGLIVAMRRQVAEKAAELGPGGIARLALMFAPAAAAGLAFERPIEERLGSPRGVAAAQVIAGACLWAADRCAADRPESDARWGDALAVGAGQAAALIPGVSRGGATITTARLRRFDRAAAGSLSRQAALPIIAGATVLKGHRLSRRGLPGELRLPFATGVAASLVATVASARLAGVLEQSGSLAPVGAYRIALGAFALVRLSGRPTHRVESSA